MSGHRVLWSLLAAALLFAPARNATAASHAGWTEALDKKGEFAFLQDWLIADGCADNGFAFCKDFPKAVAGPAKWPAALIAAALKVSPNGNDLVSEACVSNWGCNNLVPSLELLALRHKDEDKAQIAALMADEKMWQGAKANRRAVLIRIMAWTGDKSFAPRIAAMATFRPDDEYTMYALQSAAALFTSWGDKSLVDACKAVFDPDFSPRGVDESRGVCAHYLLAVGDKSIVGKLKRNKLPNELYTQVTRAAMGDDSDKADWANTAKSMASSPDRDDLAAALLSLALLGDAKAEKAFLTNVSSGNANVVFEHAKLVPIVAGLPIAKKIAAAVKKGLDKLGTKEKGGRAQAILVAFLLKQGDASALKNVKTLFASDDLDVRTALAGNLAGNAGAMPMMLVSNGLAGGAPTPGLAAVLAEAYGNESDKGVRGTLAQAWAMLPALGGI